MAPSSLFQDASQNVKVAAVVCFYMTSALIVRRVAPLSLRTSSHCATLGICRWSSCKSLGLGPSRRRRLIGTFPSNKAVLNAAPDLPLLYLFNQLVIAVILLHGASLLTTKVQIPKLEFHTAKKLTPVVTVNIFGLIFNTLCLRGVEASFFQIARGLVLPLTILVSCVYTHARPSAKVLMAAGIVTLGFLAGISPNKNLPVSATPSVVSLVYGLLSSLFIAVHAVLIKASLPHCNNSTIELAYWTNLGSALWVAPFILLNGEFGAFIAQAGSAEWDGRTFVYGSMITGVFGFLLCVAGLLSIKITSPITHMFSSVSFEVLGCGSGAPSPDTQYYLFTGREVCLTDDNWCLAVRGYSHGVRILTKMPLGLIQWN